MIPQHEKLSLRARASHLLLASVLLNVFLLLLLAGMPYEYRDVYTGGVHVTIRTNRLTGTAQRFSTARGWMPIPEPATWQPVNR